MMLAAKIAIVLAAASLVSVAAEKNCTQSNGYKYSVCGSGLKDAQQLCCKATEKCVQIKPWSGHDKVTCSEARQLTNTKAVKIVIIPLFYLILDVALIAYLVVRCEIKNPVTILCVVVLAISWPFLFSKFWAFGAYTMFLATLVACAAGPSKDCPTLPYWMKVILCALAVFQIVALLGPNEAFHVPIFGQSKAASNLEMIKNVYNQTDCNTHFDKYFAILDIEKEQKEFNPEHKFYAYCGEGWLATVQVFAVFQAIIWMIIVVGAGKELLSLGDMPIVPMPMTKKVYDDA
mmetsp:Transcript_60091/g.93400  ORF Transcript_60091/g.93400 Transcript_60091/m.93400 type:complete len:290 (-) Transcript_60091:100-969(-)